MRRGGLFITGTDTDVGKSVVTALLAGLLQRDGYDVAVAKPFVTGFREPLPSDIDLYRRFARIDEPLSLIAPVRFSEPQAPTVAASLQKRSPSFEKALGSLYILRRLHDNLLIEGIGGVLVPLNNRRTVLDLIRVSQLPALVVARPDLGTINHTCLTVAALKTANVPVAGVLFSVRGSVDPRVFPLVRAEISRMTRVPILGVVPRLNLNSGRPAAILARANKALSMEKLKRFFKPKRSE